MVFQKVFALRLCFTSLTFGMTTFLGNINEAVTDEAIQSHYGLDTVMATLTKGGVNQEFKLSNVPVAEKLEKFMEDVKCVDDSS